MSPCAVCETLRQDLRAVQAELGQGREVDRLARWMRAYGCSMKQARLLTAMADQPERVMTRERILALTVEDEAGDERLDRSADTRVKNLRKIVARRVPGTVIQTLYGLGYQLAEGGAAALKAVAGEAGGGMGTRSEDEVFSTRRVPG